MILNEDFFNDIEIKDEDLTAEQPKTSRELIEHKISESEMILMIHIDQFLGQFDIWHRIKRKMKRLKYMFNIYNINISEPFLMHKVDSEKILHDKEFPDDYILIQYEGCNLYFPEDKLREYGPDKTIKDQHLEVIVFLDKKIPVFKRARSAYNFVNNLNKCIWKDVIKSKVECFYWYGLYNINDFDYYVNIIRDSCFFYITDKASWIYQSVLNIVPEELAEQLKKKRELFPLSHKQLKTQDVKNIIKMVEQ